MRVFVPAVGSRMIVATGADPLGVFQVLDLDGDSERGGVLKQGIL